MRTEVKWVIITLLLLIVIALGGTGIGIAYMKGVHEPGSVAEEQQELQAQKPVAGITHIIMKNDAFQPEAVIVQIGTAITWTNMDASFHNIVIPNAIVTQSAPNQSQPLGPGESFTYTFMERGTFVYYCTLSPNREMEGKVVVM